MNGNVFSMALGLDIYRCHGTKDMLYEWECVQESTDTNSRQQINIRQQQNIIRFKQQLTIPLRITKFDIKVADANLSWYIDGFKFLPCQKKIMWFEIGIKDLISTRLNCDLTL